MLLPFILAVPNPPLSARKPVVDVVHGVRITDPYRWLENDRSPETRRWIAAQNRYSDAILKPIPGREAFRRDLMRFARIDRSNVAMVRGARVFFARQRPQDEQPALIIRDGIHGKDRVLLDPQPLSKDRSTSASFLDASDDGNVVVYGVRKGGEDESTVYVRDLRTGKTLDALPRGNYWGMAISPDGKTLFSTLHLNLVGNRVRRHVVGTPVSQDEEIFGKAYGPEISTVASLTEDGRYLLISVAQGWDRNEVYAKDVRSDGPVFPIVKGMDAVYDFAYGGGTLYAKTDLDAPNRRVVAINPEHPERENWRTVIPQGKDSMEAFALVGGRIFVERLHDVASTLISYDAEGKDARKVLLPGLGSAAVPVGRWKDRDGFYTYASFAQPTTTYHLDAREGKAEVWSRPTIPGFDSARYETRQVFVRGKDGARLPMFMLMRKGLRLDGKRPTLISGYGGFNASMKPGFSAQAVNWAERGGVSVVAILRGGGEYGEAWHRAGMLGNKQTVFDDLYAETTWLVKQGITSPAHIAVVGGSNGGLLVGAAVTQRPELYRAALCAVPLLDMLRYERFLQGPQWVPEYGVATDPKAFGWLRAYSPYQHVAKGVKYPATLFVTGDGDTRVAPLHARKMTAMMQWANGGNRPILLHYETKSGHSGGESVTKSVENSSLYLGFLAQQTGLPLGG